MRYIGDLSGKKLFEKDDGGNEERADDQYDDVIKRRCTDDISERSASQNGGNLFKLNSISG